MVFFLRKFIEALLLPIGMSGLLVIAGVAFRRRWIAIAGVIALYAFSTRLAGRFMLQPLEHVYEAKTVAAAPQADAIVVLSGGVVRGVTAPGVQWGETSNRYFAGFDLAKAGKAKLIVFSSTGSAESGFPSEGAIMREAAIRDGIPTESIVVTHNVLVTDDEARETAQIPGVHSILLVTSASHMPRAVLLFRAHGLDVSPFPTDERVLGRWRLSGLELIPDSTGVRLSESAIREYYGLAVYRMVLVFRPLGHLRP